MRWMRFALAARCAEQRSPRNDCAVVIRGAAAATIPCRKKMTNDEGRMRKEIQMTGVQPWQALSLPSAFMLRRSFVRRWSVVIAALRGFARTPHPLCSRRREGADGLGVLAGPPIHDPAAKAGASSAHSKRCRAWVEVTEFREAFGVRPACWRFRFMAPTRVAGNVAPPDVGGYALLAFQSACRQSRR